MTYALAVLMVTVLMLLVKDAWMSRRRDAENDAWRTLLADETAAHRREVADLLQRIQGPELAVVQHDVGKITEAELPQPPASDEQWEGYEEHRQALQRLEELENAQFDRV